MKKPLRMFLQHAGQQSHCRAPRGRKPRLAPGLEGTLALDVKGAEVHRREAVPLGVLVMELGEQEVDGSLLLGAMHWLWALLSAETHVTLGTPETQ